MKGFTVLFISFIVFLCCCLEARLNASLPPIGSPETHESCYSQGDSDRDSYDAEKDMESWFARYNKKVFQHDQIIRKQKGVPKKHQWRTKHHKKRITKKSKRGDKR
jgi:hypothetical protein